MPLRSRRTVEIESLDDFDQQVANGASSMRGWRVQGVDLTARTPQLLQLRPAHAILLGSPVSEDAEAHLRSGGALMFPAIPALPFDPYRAAVYTPAELYAGITGSGYEETPDALVYAWTLESDDDLTRHLGRALHDHAMDDALKELVGDKLVVGVMGGHAWTRTDPRYADAASFGCAAVERGLYVASGGGPGAMEAANLGAYLPDASALDEALTILAAVPTFTPSVTAWARAAFDVRRRWPGGRDSLGIPTWFYGHEPPNVFASSIAKYFQNSLREDTLLRRCNAGIVFLPGAAGTVQEIFQDACENYYAAERALTPMVLVGAHYWTEELPAWPLLERLAADHPMATALHLVDDVEDAVTLMVD